MGKGGQAFNLWNFRTMYQMEESRSGAQWAAKSDPRLTREGRWLRQTGLAELPQLGNVPRGEMSLVGPRPERMTFANQLRIRVPLYDERVRVAPGITGLAQVEYVYGSTEDYLNKMVFDLYYVSHCSLALDLKILGKTLIRTLYGRRSQ